MLAPQQAAATTLRQYLQRAADGPARSSRPQLRPPCRQPDRQAGERKAGMLGHQGRPGAGQEGPAVLWLVCCLH